ARAVRNARLPEHRSDSMPSPRTPPHLFRHWEELSQRIRAARHIILFLDFDGTLVAFRPRPGQVRLRQATRRAIRGITRHAGVQIVIVSGRRRGTLIRHIRAPGVKYTGLYGWEEHSRCRLPRDTAAQLSLLRAALLWLPVHVPGVRIE